MNADNKELRAYRIVVAELIERLNEIDRRECDDGKDCECYDCITDRILKEKISE